MPFPEFPDPLKPKRTGTQFAFEDIEGAFELKGYVEMAGDLPRLIGDIVEAQRNNTVVEDFYFKEYESQRLVQVTRTYGSGKIKPYPTPILQNDGITEEEVYYRLRVNQRPDRDLDPHPFYRIDINLDKVKAAYNVDFLFVKGTDLDEEDEEMDVVVLDETFKNSGQVGKRILAVTLSTDNVDHFIFLNQNLHSHMRDIEGYIKSKFEKVYRGLDKSDYEKVSNFYEQAPLLFLSQLSLDTLIWDVVRILLYDKETWLLDNSNVMIKTLGVILGKGGTATLYDWLYAHPGLIKEIYYNLDLNGHFILYGDLEVPHKTIFATMLALICNDQWQGDNAEHLQTHGVFNVTKGHQVNSNILSGDQFPDKYTLTQEELQSFRGPLIGGSNAIDIDKYEWVAIETHNLHPLDLVTLILEGPDGEPQTLIIPAIFVKDLAFNREWAEVMKTLRLAVDIFMIIVSIATLMTGPVGFMLALSLIDLGLATIDIPIQAFAAEISKSEIGRQFLKLWEAVYLVGGIVTGLPFLGALLRGGARLLLLVSGKVLEQLIAMLKYALLGVKNFPRFVKGVFEIFPNIAGSLGKVGTEMPTLAKEGVMLVKGVVEGEKEAKYFLSYMGGVFRGGTIEDIKKAIAYIYKRAGGQLKKYLAEVLAAKMLRYVNSQGARGKIPLTVGQIEEIIEYALKYGIDRSAIKYSDTMSTGFKLILGVDDLLYIGQDIMPGINAVNANSKLSWKSAIAHELEGHRAAELAGKTHPNPLYEEVQASMRASLFGKDLTATEREVLELDAIERLERHELGTKLSDILDQLWLEKF